MITEHSEPEVGHVHSPFKVVGVSFIPGYPDNLLLLSEEIERRKGESVGWNSSISNEASDGLFAGIAPDIDSISLVLIRNPDNEFDDNAIEVHVPWLGRGNTLIGHVSANQAAKYAPLMDSGWEYDGCIFSVDVLPEKPNQPGITIEITLVSKGK